MSQPRDDRGRFSRAGGESSGTGGFDRALEESAERLRDMTREIEAAARGIAAFGSGDVPRAGGGTGGVGGGGRSGGSLGGLGKTIAGIGAAITAPVGAGTEALRSFGRAGDPVQAFRGHLIQMFDPSGAHTPARMAGAATLGILGQAAAAGASVSGADVSREFSFQLLRAQRTQQVEHLVEERVSKNINDRFTDNAADLLLGIKEAIEALPDKLNPFGGGGSR